MKYPVDVQNEWLKKLLAQAQHTEWGKRYEFGSIQNFVFIVPVLKSLRNIKFLFAAIVSKGLPGNILNRFSVSIPIIVPDATYCCHRGNIFNVS